MPTFMNSIISVFITCAMYFTTRACAVLSSLSESPLFSSILTIHILLFLYFPPFLLKLVLSPVTLIAFSLLVALLRLGSPCRNAQNPNSDPKTAQQGTPDQTQFDPLTEPKFLTCTVDSIDDLFVEWDVKAPLEVIYEEHEGTEDRDEDEPVQLGRLENTLSLEVYNPETDSDEFSEREFGLVGEMGWPEDSSVGDDTDREGLIEIALDSGREGSGRKVEEDDFHAEEEDNLIEIDLSVNEGDYPYSNGD